LQQDLVAPTPDSIPDTLILVEHPDTITLGRSAQNPDNVVFAGEIPVFAIERGGDVTYHGPGQLVAYPIFLLREVGTRSAPLSARPGRSAYAHARGFRHRRTRRPGLTGVWISGRRCAAQAGLDRRRRPQVGHLARARAQREHRSRPLCRHPSLRLRRQRDDVHGARARALVDFAAVKNALAKHTAAVFERAWLQAVDSPDL
jgi:hypothetical protein